VLENTLHAHTAGAGKHPARPYCWCWKTPCTPLLLVVERHHITWLAGPAGAGRAAMGMEELLVLGLRREVEMLSSPVAHLEPEGGRGCPAGLCRDRRRGAARCRFGGSRRVTQQVLWPAPCPQRCCARA
jgi:hypothetical protein